MVSARPTSNPAAGQRAQVQEYFSQRWLTSFDPIKCSAVIANCGNQTLWQLVLQALACMQEADLLPDVVICTAALTACARGEEPGKALLLLSDMPKLVLIPTAVTYGAAVQACARGSLWRSALEILNASRETDSKMVNSFAVTAAIAACGKAGHWRVALCLLQD